MAHTKESEMTESERRAKITLETVIRFDRLALQYAKTEKRRNEIRPILAKHEADYLSKYGQPA